MNLYTKTCIYFLTSGNPLPAPPSKPTVAPKPAMNDYQVPPIPPEPDYETAPPKPIAKDYPLVGATHPDYELPEGEGSPEHYQVPRGEHYQYPPTHNEDFSTQF